MVPYWRRRRRRRNRMGDDAERSFDDWFGYGCDCDFDCDLERLQ
jgi:hypothetical protein